MGDDNAPRPPMPPPPASDDFMECKINRLTVKPRGQVDWFAFAVVFDTPSYEQDAGGKVTITTNAGGESIPLPTSVKGGKLHVETRAAHGAKPISKKFKDKAEEVQDFVDRVNTTLSKNGKQFGTVSVQNGELVLTKVPLAAPGKAEEKDGKQGAKPVKGGPFPHVPAWEKVGAGLLFGASILLGVGFMNAGDSTEQVAIGGGERAGGGSTIAYKRVTTARVTPPGGDPVEADATFGGGRVETALPLFSFDPHRVELDDDDGDVVDAFVLGVTSEEGSVAGTTDQGGEFDCSIDHGAGIDGSPSSGLCIVTPSGTGGGPDRPPEGVTATEEKSGKPWSLAAIPGAALALGGGLALDERRRR